MSGSDRWRTVLIDDHPVVLEGTSKLLAAAGDFLLVGTASSGEHAMVVARESRPDLILLDLRLGDSLAPELCRRLRAELPDVTIVIFTAFADELLIRAALAEGAAGVVLKDVHQFDLIRALRDFRAGRHVVDGRLRADPATEHTRNAVTDLDADLTPREREVLRLLARGMSSKQIAIELQLMPNTVRSYSQSLLTKLGAHSRIEAVARARLLRLV